MAIFIPEWPRVAGNRHAFKSVLKALDDAYVVRRCVRPAVSSGGASGNADWAPDLFIRHPQFGWLAVAICDTPFAALDPQRLFDVDAASAVAFEQWLARFDTLDGLDAETNGRLSKLAVMASCSAAEARQLSLHCGRRFKTPLVAREAFTGADETCIRQWSARLDAACEQRLLRRYFPESEIPAACTTQAQIQPPTVARRDFHRDHTPRAVRFFLDVQQEWAAKLDLDPAVELPLEQAETAKDCSVRLVNGVAGSGKTLIAVNRALLLARICPQQSVLLLIHNTPIVADIRYRLHRAYGSVPENLEIETFYGWAVRQWYRVFRGKTLKMARQSDVLQWVRHHRARWPDLKWSDEQLAGEFDFINANLLTDEAAYLDANRAGQGFALQAKQRAQIWMLYGAVTQGLAQMSEPRRLWSAVPRELCAVDDRRAFDRYRHILIDEAQFFAPSWFRLVKRALEVDGSLFLCADPNQGFMKSRLSWLSAGLDVVGRTKRLHRSYRTTRAILEAADRMLSAATLRGDPDDFLAPEFDGMEAGQPPLLIEVDTPQDAVDQIGSEVAAALHGDARLPSSALLVIYGDNVNRTALLNELSRRVGADHLWWLNDEEHKKVPPHGYGRDYLRVAYLDTATGLEAVVVFLVGFERLLAGWREGASADGGDGAQDAAREAQARKLYMAMTRAGQRLVLVSSQRAPDEVGRVFVKAGCG